MSDVYSQDTNFLLEIICRIDRNSIFEHKYIHMINHQVLHR